MAWVMIADPRDRESLSFGSSMQPNLEDFVSPMLSSRWLHELGNHERNFPTPVAQWTLRRYSPLRFGCSSSVSIWKRLFRFGVEVGECRNPLAVE